MLPAAGRGQNCAGGLASEAIHIDNVFCDFSRPAQEGVANAYPICLQGDRGESGHIWSCAVFYGFNTGWLFGGCVHWHFHGFLLLEISGVVAGATGSERGTGLQEQVCLVGDNSFKKNCVWRIFHAFLYRRVISSVRPQHLRAVADDGMYTEIYNYEHLESNVKN